MLLNLLRGAGLDGLAGMRPDRHPLLGLRRPETRALCADSGSRRSTIRPTTRPRYRRNRVRHELLPLLDDIAGRDVAAVLARQAELLRDDADLLDGLAAGLDPTDARALAPLRRPRWPAAPCAGGWPTRIPPDAATVDRVLAVAAGRGRGLRGRAAGGGSSATPQRLQLVLDDSRSPARPAR